jgi:hypothetical protein
MPRTLPTRVRWVLAAVAAAGAAVWAVGPLLRRAADAPSPPAAPVWFEDVGERAGVRFRHFDPATPLNQIPETMGSGVAWIDYDGDGWPDLFCVQAAPLPPAAPDPAHTHKLYRNNRDGTFADVTAAVGLDRAAFGTGVAVGDYDNDGFDDLLVTALGGLTLFHNVPDAAAPGGRRFADVTAAAGLSDPHYATSAAWGDFDGDGGLDLYVCNYVEIDPARPVVCRQQGTGRVFQCAPTAYPATTHRLYRNNRDGTFADVSASAGVAAVPPAPGLGVVVVDLDGDGRPDIYVANDLSPAYLFRNKGGWAFEEVALRSGCGLGENGSRLAGMGVEAGDLDGTGRPSLFVTNFQSAPNAVFLNRGRLQFVDGSSASGLGPASLNRLKFGTALLDADLDGNLDIAVANGHVERGAREVLGVPYAQPAQLFVGDGGGRYRDASDGCGADFVRPRVGRGLARCDYDNDGRPDLALSGVGEPTAVLRNVADTGNGWVSLELLGDGRGSNRNAIGAVVRVEWAGAVRHHFVTGGGSYLSASDRRLALGVGPTATRLDRVTVRWPSGKAQEFRDLPVRAFWRLHEGRAEPERVTPAARTGNP